jgi:hypothetical protein
MKNKAICLICSEAVSALGDIATLNVYLHWTDCLIHKRTFKSLKAENVKTVVKIVNLIFFKGLNNSEFQDSVHNLKTEFKCIAYYSEV